MEIVAEWWTVNPEATQNGLMLYGFVQLIAAIFVSRFLKPPK
jgi:hypothetical protein